MARYPVVGRRSTIDCPVHHTSVALDAEGRIASKCIGCRSEVRRAMQRWAARRRRLLAVA